MNTQIRSQLYIIALEVCAVGLTALAVWLWPVAENTPPLWLLLTLVLLVALAGRFPIKLSRQAEASLFTVPLFMAVLLLHPMEAVLIAMAGTLISERMARAPASAIIFNVSVSAVAAGLAGIVFFSLKAEEAPLALTHQQMLAAAAAGLTLHVTNIMLVAGMLTLRKGRDFWRSWKDTFVFEAIQEGGLLTVGAIASLLVLEAWWGLVLVLIPAVLAYYGFERSVNEAAQKARLAEELEQKLKELKELQAQLVQSAKLASVGTLATGVAHEINNPVFAITGRADILLKNADKHLRSEKAVEYIQTIQQMGKRISTIVRHLLDYARPSEDMAEVRIDDAIEGALALLGNKVKNHRIVKEYEATPVVKGVPAQLQQVFVNLISNSADATPEWGTITVGCRVDDSTAVAYVKDTGIGISRAVQERLFEPFFTTKEVGKGMGLGMFVCHRIVTTHKGQITVESEEGKGTTIWVKIPLAANGAASPQQNGLAREAGPVLEVASGAGN